MFVKWALPHSGDILFDDHASFFSVSMNISYQLELTDVETALIAWTDEAEIAREARKPYIGW